MAHMEKEMESLGPFKGGYIGRLPPKLMENQMRAFGWGKV